VTSRIRVGTFLVAAGGLGALLVWAFTGLPEFGHGESVYGSILNHVAVRERHVVNVVVATVFDYRGFDTLVEESILFAAVMAVSMLLRDAREGVAPERDEVQADAIRGMSMLLVGPSLVLALYVIAHGTASPGGGFQGGVVVAGTVALVYVGVAYAPWERVAPTPLWDAVEGVGVAAYAVLGLVGLVAAGSLFENTLPLGLKGSILAGGTIPLLNWASGLAVGAAFVLLFSEFLQQLQEERIRQERAE